MSGPSTTEAIILALLVDDVSDADLREALTRLLGAAEDDDERLRIEQLGELAFELHRARADDRRRALGLTALSDTATDLAAHLEVDELLAAICRRARLLLGTDVAYVTLRDEDAGAGKVRQLRPAPAQPEGRSNPSVGPSPAGG